MNKSPKHTTNSVTCAQSLGHSIIESFGAEAHKQDDLKNRTQLLKFCQEKWAKFPANCCELSKKTWTVCPKSFSLKAIQFVNWSEEKKN